MKQFAPAAERNAEPIFEVLDRVVPDGATVFEVASGTGQHAAYMAQRRPDWTWQPSDPDPRLRASIEAWTDEGGVTNVLPPLDLDVTRSEWPSLGSDIDAILCVNLLHVAPWNACEGLFRHAADLLDQSGKLLVYGPFNVNGAYTSDGNRAFDQSLRRRDPRLGLRDVVEVEAEASRRGLILRETVAMPANNLTLVFDQNND